MKRILTMEQLYDFFASRDITHFSAAETGYELAVHVPGNFDLDNDVVDAEGKLPIRLKACHTGLNRNKSYI